MKVNSWDIIKHLGETNNKALRLAPMDNVLRVQKTKHGCQVTFGVGDDLVAKIANGQVVGGFLYCDRDEWRRVEAELKQPCKRQAAYDTGAQLGASALVNCSCPRCTAQETGSARP